jgi:hypothetical protein
MTTLPITRTAFIQLLLSIFLLMVSAERIAQTSDAPLAGVTLPGFGEYRPGVVETGSLDNSPFSQSEREFILLEKKHQREKGWTPDSDGIVSEFEFYLDKDSDFYRRGKRTLEESLVHLQVVPASFDGTLFAGAELQTVMHAGGFVNGTWTGLVRVMTVPKLGRVVLEEYDYVAAGSHIQIAEEIMDTEINGKPSLFTVWKGPGQQAVTELEWFTDNKHFRLLLEGVVVQSSKRYQRLMEMAWTLR